MIRKTRCVNRMQKLDEKKWLTFYKEEVENNLLRYWEQMVDEKYGGIYTCINNKGDSIISKDKYVWSQGRFLWLLTRIVPLIKENKLNKDYDMYKEEAEKCKEFLLKHCFLPNDNCSFILSREGNIKRLNENAPYDLSIYADCFLSIGISQSIKAFGLKEDIDWGLKIYDNIYNRIQSGQFNTEPYPIPEGYKTHSIPMILLNVTTELLTSLKQVNHPRAEELKLRISELIDHILMDICRDNSTIREHRAPNENNELITRHSNPGHTIECMWFIIQGAEEIGRLDQVIDKVTQITKQALEIGWDQQYGGILRFVDYEGGAPKGDKRGYAYEKLIEETWDTKLWWPHSEALYTTLLLYKITHDEDFLQWYNKCHDYVFRTFPNEDKDVGEWIQIRDRQGKPIEKVVALPVKDPFHILRNFILIIELLNGIDKE